MQDSLVGRNDAHMNTYHTLKTTSEGYGTAEGRAVVVKRLSVENGRTSTQTCLIRVYLLADVNCMSGLCGSGAHRSSLVSLSMYLSSSLALGVLDWLFLCQEALSKWQCGEVGVMDGRDMTVDIPKTNYLQLRVGESR